MEPSPRLPLGPTSPKQANAFRNPTGWARHRVRRPLDYPAPLRLDRSRIARPTSEDSPVDLAVDVVLMRSAKAGIGRVRVENEAAVADRARLGGVRRLARQEVIDVVEKSSGGRVHVQPEIG